MSDTYLRYSDDLERPGPDEDAIIEKIVTSLRGNNEAAYAKYHHGIRDAHAKSHGLLRGVLTVDDDLPAELAQGLFAAPGSYPIVARLSSTAGAIRSDQLRGIHGLGVKLIGVDGPRCLPDDGATTQDFLFVTHREFPFADAKTYAGRGMKLAWLLARLPDWGLKTASTLFSIAGAMLKPVHVALPETLQLFTKPNTHILGMTFFTSAAMRHGDHVVKMCVVPLSKSVVDLEPVPLTAQAGPDGYRNMVVDFFATQTAEYELRAQLCTDLATMPIEDATVEWPEASSPYRRIAKLSFPVQDPGTPERQAYGDDVLSFTPFRGLAAHRPLGSINRLKLRVYDSSSDYRHQVNGVAKVEPSSVADLPA